MTKTTTYYILQFPGTDPPQYVGRIQNGSWDICHSALDARSFHTSTAARAWDNVSGYIPVKVTLQITVEPE